MKYIIAVATLTFVIAVQSSVIPLPLSLAGPSLLTSSGVVLAHSPTIAIAAAPAPEKSIAIHASTAPVSTIIAAPHLVAGHHIVAAPHIIAGPHILELAGPQPHAITIATGPAPAVIAAPAIVAAEGRYLAKTRGAEHSAPLPGHINSASSINLEPAPGTL